MEKRTINYETYNKTIMGIIENLDFQKDNTPPPSSIEKSIFEDKHIPTNSKIKEDHISMSLTYFFETSLGKRFLMKEKIQYNFTTQILFFGIQS